MFRDRGGQSEVIGVILLTAVVVLLTVLVGVFLIPTFAEDTDRKFLSIDAEATSQNVTLWHANGDRLDTADLDVIVRGDSSSERYAFETFTQLRGSDTSTFQQGDKWYRNHGIDSDRMEILVVHVPNNQVLDRKIVDVEETLAARFDWSPTNPSTGQEITFDGSESGALEGTIESYSWEFGDGITGSGETTTHTYDSAGIYEMSLTVETEDERTATRTREIEIFAPSPTTSFTYSPENPDVDETVTFDASDSEPALDDGEIEEYNWAFGDGTTGSGETTTHSYDSSGSYVVSLTVVSENGESSTMAQQVVVDTAFFEVSDFDAPAVATQGDKTTASASVDNIGGEAGNQRIEYRFENTTRLTQNLTLDPGENKTVAFDYTIPEDQSSGEFDHGIYSQNDSDSGAITISGGQAFDVEIIDTNSPVSQGTDLIVNASIQNNGTIQDTQTTELVNFDGDVVDSAEITLNASESEQTELNWDTTAVNPQTDDVTVRSETDSGSATVTILEPEIRIFNARPDGDTVVDFDVENPKSDTVTVTGITLNDTSSEAEEVDNGPDPELIFSNSGSFNPGPGASGSIIIGSQQYLLDTNEDISSEETTTGTLEEFDRSMVGENLTITLYYEFDGNSEKHTQTVDIESRPYFSVDIIDTNSPVEQDDTVQLQYAVTNSGDEPDTQDVRLEFDGNEGETVETSLGPGESDENTLQYELGGNFESGEYVTTVFTENESAWTTVDVIEKDTPFLEVSITGTNEPVAEGENLTVDADITNTGEADAIDEKIALDIDGVGETDNTTVSVDADETASVTLEWQTGDGDAGDYDAIVGSGDDQDTVEIEVLEQADPQFDDLSAEVTSSSGRSGNIQTFEVDGDIIFPDTTGEIEFLLEDGSGDELENSRTRIDMTGTFTEAFDGEQSGEVDITVRLIDDGGQEYEICESEEPLEAGNSLTFSDFRCE